jgi:hypothetical protein
MTERGLFSDTRMRMILGSIELKVTPVGFEKNYTNCTVKTKNSNYNHF